MPLVARSCACQTSIGVTVPLRQLPAQSRWRVHSKRRVSSLQAFVSPAPLVPPARLVAKPKQAASGGAARKFWSSGAGAGATDAQSSFSPLAASSCWQASQARRARQPSKANTSTVRVISAVSANAKRFSHFIKRGRQEVFMSDRVELGLAEYQSLIRRTARRRRGRHGRRRLTGHPAAVPAAALEQMRLRHVARPPRGQRRDERQSAGASAHEGDCDRCDG